MEATKWTDVVQALASSGAVIAALCGLWLVTNQLRQVERTIRGGTYATLCQQSIEILKAIGECKCYAYFYDNKPLTEAEPNRAQVLCVAEMVVNYLDLVALQKTNMPPAVWARWRNFTIDTLRNSAVVRDHLMNYARWYSSELNEIVSATRASLR